ncbi:FxLYD domain-containing protein [Natronomonas sp. LN261]|uniref:FxLYD domain-containing protein n=1 Tax=Natronomonas sp. LN261 TaxID=2750669 RepID=UPI0015EEDDA7|nr:FxLYD domain-containing protein [Natronomonas sp. LN261]
MAITNTDALAMALGAVAVVVSGFVLAYSAWGGIAFLVAGALALSIAPLRARLPAAGPAVLLAFFVLCSVGTAGFLVGFGVFDSPEIDHDAEATLHDAGTDSATVVLTGTVRNVGDGPAEAVSVSVTLYDADGDTLADETVRLRAVRPGTRQQFFVRFGPDEALSAFAASEVDVSVDP